MSALTDAIRNGEVEKVAKLVLTSDRNEKTPEGNPILFLAVEQGAMGIAKILLDAGFPPNARNREHSPLLLTAIQSGNEAMAQLLLEAGAKVDATIPSGEQFLQKALSAGLYKLAISLVERGASVLCSDRNGTTALHLAAAAGNNSLCELFMNKGANPFTKNRQGKTVFEVALANGHQDCQKMMCLWYARRAVESEQARKAGKTSRFLFGATQWEICSMEKAVEIGDMEMIDAFLEAGADVNEIWPHWLATPLFRVQNAEVAKRLFAAGALVDHRDKEGKTALLTILEKWENEEQVIPVLRVFLEHGANPNLADQAGMSPGSVISRRGWRAAEAVLRQAGGKVGADTLLHEAARSNDEKTVERLLAKGEDPDPVNRAGQTPLHLAAAGRFLGLVRRFLAAGADVNRPQAFDGDQWAESKKLGKSEIWTEMRKGYLPLHYAASSGDLELATLLLEHGSEVTVRDGVGDTPLHLATERGFGEIAFLLLEHGADMNLQGKYSETPLHLSAKHGRKAIVEDLVRRGADLSITDMHGETALDLASHEEPREVFSFLLEKGAPGAAQGWENRCEDCNRPYFHGHYQMGISDFGEVKKGCLTCGKGVCNGCSIVVSDHSDVSWKICKACFKGLQARDESKVRDPQMIPALQKLVEDGKIKFPKFPEAVSCPVCSKSFSLAQAINDQQICYDCHQFVCPGCSKPGYIASRGSTCRHCEKKDTRKWDEIAGNTISAEEEKTRTCQRCKKSIRGRMIDVFRKIAVRGTLTCQSCGIEMCHACARNQVKSGRLNCYCIECADKLGIPYRKSA